MKPPDGVARESGTRIQFFFVEEKAQSGFPVEFIRRLSGATDRACHVSLGAVCRGGAECSTSDSAWKGRGSPYSWRLAEVEVISRRRNRGRVQESHCQDVVLSSNLLHLGGTQEVFARGDNAAPSYSCHIQQRQK
ncbi:hypothetical protein EYF80_029937 [Liparis tanakae]|uniref:Uncharacterized protein n=1 Tax=Liparis tanakae TaxID=230148 RepID=A0A4Z2H2M1_9TELE|nr:hypothetical protein EYF80_029937 [Liparis tanakae]